MSAAALSAAALSAAALSAAALASSIAFASAAFLSVSLIFTVNAEEVLSRYPPAPALVAVTKQSPAKTPVNKPALVTVQIRGVDVAYETAPNPEPPVVESVEVLANWTVAKLDATTNVSW